MSTDISLCVMWAYNSTQVWYFILSRPTMKAAEHILLCVVLYSVRSHCNTRKIRLTLDCIQVKYIASLKSATCLWKFVVCFAKDRCAHTFSVSSPGIITFLKRIRVIIEREKIAVKSRRVYSQQNLWSKFLPLYVLLTEQGFFLLVFFETFLLQWFTLKQH